MVNDESVSGAGSAPEEPLAGVRLAAARRSRKLSLQDVSNELHLDPHKVSALERNRFDELGAPVFVKGYLRKYAEIVGLSPDTVLADYRRLEQSEEAPPLVTAHRSVPTRDFPLGAFLVAILVLALAAGAAWLWFSGRLDGLRGGDAPPAGSPAVAQPAAGTATESAPSPGPAETAPDGNDAASAAPVEADTAPEVVAETPPEPVLAAPESVPPPPGQVELTLSFSGDCWTEVSDAAGDRLFFGLGRAGETVSVTGSAPLQVLLGNAANAALSVDGASFAIPASARRGDTARLTIDGGGATP